VFQDSTVKDLYSEVAKCAREDEDNFYLKLNGKPPL